MRFQLLAAGVVLLARTRGAILFRAEVWEVIRAEGPAVHPAKGGALVYRPHRAVLWCRAFRCSAQRAKSSPDCPTREEGHATILCTNLVAHHLQQRRTSCVRSKSRCPRRNVSDVKSSCRRFTNGTRGIEDELLARWAGRCGEERRVLGGTAVPGLRPSLGEPTPLRGSHPPPQARNRNGLLPGFFSFLIFSKASVAALRTDSFSSPSTSVRAEMAVFASEPIYPRASATARRTSSSISLSNSTRAGVAVFASRPMFPKAKAA